MGLILNNIGALLTKDIKLVDTSPEISVDPSKYPIIIDPGHGATAPKPKGTFSRPLMYLTENNKVEKVCGGKRHSCDSWYRYYREDTGTQIIAWYCQHYLVDRGYKVFLTRQFKDDTNAKYQLLDKVKHTTYQGIVWGSGTFIRKYANQVNSFLSVHIHTNGGRGKGCSAFYISPEGLKLAKAITGKLNKNLNLNVRRIAKKRYSMLKGHSSKRTCLIECAFHDNPDELALLVSTEKIKAIGESLAQGIIKYTNSVI